MKDTTFGKLDFFLFIRKMIDYFDTRNLEEKKRFIKVQKQRGRVGTESKVFMESGLKGVKVVELREH